MKASLDDYTFTVNAKQTSPAQTIKGSMFICSAVSAAGLQVKFDAGGSWMGVLAGMKVKLPQGDSFEKLTFRNTTPATNITFTFYAGTADMELTKLT